MNALRALLEAQGRSLEALWVGAEESLEERVAAGNSIGFQAVATSKVRRSKNPLKLVSADNIRDMGKASQERAINRLKQHRAVATRYGKLCVRYTATIQIAAIDEWF